MAVKGGWGEEGEGGVEWWEGGVLRCGEVWGGVKKGVERCGERGSRGGESWRGVGRCGEEWRGVR